jgi:proteasome lid subunit RPN8/RPN11
MWSETIGLMQRMWQQLLRVIRQFCSPGPGQEQLAPPPGPGSAMPLRRLERVLVSSAVLQSLFDMFADHRNGDRGEEETGWVLLGYRRDAEAVVLAALPAGTNREAGVAHVRFNTLAQAVATRILRTRDRQLTILGVVHTHPGSLRHPSRGDYEGDSEWVKLLRGKEGVFGIGTVEAEQDDNWLPMVAQPTENSWSWRGMRFNWYALAAGDRNYRPIPVQVVLGEDLARPFLPVWETLEWHAAGLEELFRRLSALHVEACSDSDAAGLNSYLSVSIPLENGQEIRALLHGPKMRFFYDDGEQTYEVAGEPPVDRGIFLLLAELARRRELCQSSVESEP